MNLGQNTDWADRLPNLLCSTSAVMMHEGVSSEWFRPLLRRWEVRTSLIRGLSTCMWAASLHLIPPWTPERVANGRQCPTASPSFCFGSAAVHMHMCSVVPKWFLPRRREAGGCAPKLPIPITSQPSWLAVKIQRSYLFNWRDARLCNVACLIFHPGIPYACGCFPPWQGLPGRCVTPGQTEIRRLIV